MAAMYSRSARGTEGMLFTVLERRGVLDFDLLPQLDDSVDGNLEIRCGLFGEFAGDGKQVFTPQGHPDFAAGNDDLATKEESGVRGGDVEAMVPAVPEDLADVGALHESAVGCYPPETVTDVFDVHLLVMTHPRDIFH